MAISYLLNYKYYIILLLDKPWLSDPLEIAKPNQTSRIVPKRKSFEGKSMSNSPYCANVCPTQNLGDPICAITYRGEHGAGVLNTKLGAYSFGPKELATYYALDPNDFNDIVEEPKLIEAQITISKPFVTEPDDPFLEVGHIARQLGVDQAARIAIKYADEIMNTSNWDQLSTDLGISSVSDWLNDSMHIEDPETKQSELQDKLDCLYFDGYRYFDDPQEIALLMSHGFDGAHVGSSGVGAGESEYRVFSKSQIEILSVQQLTPNYKIAFA